MPSRSANSLIAGAGSGLVASVATCPLDVIKTKLQAQRAVYGHNSYEGVAGTIRTVIKHDGIRGLYRGLGPTILGCLPTWAIYFAVYDGIKRHFGEKPVSMFEDMRHVYPDAQVKSYQLLAREHPWILHLLAAMTAGTACTICTNPVWVIKTRFITQPQEESRYKHTLDAALTIYRTEGLSAFFRGLLPSLLAVAHVAVQFPVYEHLKLHLAAGGPIEELPWVQDIGCIAVAKVTASTVTYPYKVVRTRLQTKKHPLPMGRLDRSNSEHQPIRGMIRTTKRIIVYEGWRALYSGFLVNLARTLPNSAMTMLTYEVLVRYLNQRSGFS